MGRRLPILGERRFSGFLQTGAGEDPAPFPLGPLLGQTKLTLKDLAVLAAFDLIVLEEDRCRFADAAKIRTFAQLISEGRSLGDAVRILVRVRDLSPLGRHKVVLTPSGDAALQWRDGLTTLEGQGLLPLNTDLATVDELFEAAALAEAEGNLSEAVRLYDLCGRADPSDAVAFYNLANIHLALGDYEGAVLSYQRSLSRDADLVDARYNLAQALEALGRPEAASKELASLLEIDPRHADGLFNLAQLRMKGGDSAAAKALFERYLALDPPEAWAVKARKAIVYCSRPPV